MTRRTIRLPSAALFAAALFVYAAPAAAQVDPIRVEEDAPCDHHGQGDRYCEVREYSLEATGELAVDAGANGGIEVVGWDRDEVRLVARIHGWDRGGDPRGLVRAVEIRTGPVIEADGPRTRGRAGWSASYELRVPRETALRLDATNGGIHLEQLAGTVDARTTNGGLHLVGGAGRVRGETTNGGIHLELTGAQWAGAGADLRTTNGGVEIVVPGDYSAELETGTVNGGMRLDIPITVQGRIDRRIRTRLGDGGALIRAITTNGGVVVR